MSGPLEPHGGTERAATRVGAVGLASCIAYLAATLPLLGGMPAGPGPLALHVAMLALCVGASSARVPIPSIVRTALPLAIGPLLYVELRWLVPALGSDSGEALVALWEARWFPGAPSRTLAQRLPSRALSELLHLCYLSYYALVLVPPLVLLARRRHGPLARTVLALAITYLLCFITYLLFPVAGPRFVFGPAEAPAGPIRAIVLGVLERGSSRGTAFPSSHVAASVAATLAAFGVDRRVGLGLGIVTVGLALGAVYGGYHYAVDACAGLLWGVAGWASARALASIVERRGEGDRDAVVAGLEPRR